MLGDNVLSMLSLNMFKTFLESVIRPFRRTFWYQK